MNFDSTRRAWICIIGSMLHRPEDLTPVYRAVADAVSRRLPPDIAERLVWSRKACRHSSKTDMILFNAWDKWQTGLERNQFNYCLNYKPLRPEDDGRIWLLQTRCNIERIAKTYPTARDAIRVPLRRNYCERISTPCLDTWLLPIECPYENVPLEVPTVELPIISAK